MPIKIKVEFKIATRETGVNGELDFKHPDVFMTAKDVAPFDEKSSWSALVDVANVVSVAKGATPTASSDRILASLVRKGDGFYTSAMKDALGITDAHSGALAVKMDDPVDLWIAMDRYCRDVLKLKPAINFQDGTGVNFIEGAGNMWDCIAQPAILMGLKQAFAVKWDRMVARPQETIAAAIADPLGAPDMFLKAIEPYVDMAAVAADPRKFTVYPEGCPPHPSYVAGHGALAGVVYALLYVKYGLGGQSAAHDELGQTLLSFAHCRSLAGVHYFQDNSRGFKVGIDAVKLGLSDLSARLGVDDAFIGSIEDGCKGLDGEWAI